MNQAMQTPKQHRYLAHLLGFNYTIQYRSGRANVVIDALSRVMEDPPASLCLLSIPQFVFLEDLHKELASLPTFVELRDQIKVDPTAYPKYTLTSELILHKGLIWLPFNSSFIKLLLEEFHQSHIGGHMGVQKTLHRLQENFTWSSI